MLISNKKIQVKQNGFTIVELLIVIIVIAILAAITIVSYNGITRRAEVIALQTDLKQTATKLNLEKVEANGTYPASLTAELSSKGENTELTYSRLSGDTFCLSAASTQLTDVVFSITQAGVINEGYCPGHGPLVATNENCFAFNASQNNITDYYANEFNNAANPACPRAVVIPETIGGVAVTRLHHYAFQAKSLTSVHIPSSVTWIGELAFSNNSLTGVDLPSSITSLGAGAFTNNQFPDSDAFIYHRNSSGAVVNTSLNSYAGARRSNIVIPNNVAVILTRAFTASNITSITLHEGITSINLAAFSNNLLTSITFPSSLTYIDQSAFNTNQLESVTIPPTVRVMRPYVFQNNRLTSVNLPSTTTDILTQAFRNNLLTNVSIPTATNLNSGAFDTGVTITRY